MLQVVVVRVIVLQIVVQQDVRAGTLEQNEGPSIFPQQEVANRAHVSKRDQFWDQFRGTSFGVSIF
jgi:hypothetical protein